MSTPSADGADVYVAGIMEHIEEAGIHSGDSACSLPPYSLPPDDRSPRSSGRPRRWPRRSSVVGLMNVQFAVKDGEVYVLEVNPRATRTVPFVAKATGVPIAKIAARVMAGEKLADFAPRRPSAAPHVAVKEAVFPFARFPGVDLILGPEMKSTGEVMGLDRDFGRAFAKSQLGGGHRAAARRHASSSRCKRPRQGGAGRAVPAAGRAGLRAGRDPRHRRLPRRGRACRSQPVNKVLEGRPHIVDAMKSGEVQLVFNTTEGAQAIADSFSLRRTALMHTASPTTRPSPGRGPRSQAIARACGRGALKSRRCNPTLSSF